MIHAYVWVFLIALGMTPVILVLLKRRSFPTEPSDWILAIIEMIGIQILFWYVQRRCSSENLSYWDGLLYVAAFNETGWPYLSMVFVFPSLLLIFIASMSLSIYYEFVPPSAKAAFQFHRMISFFYRNRMLQKRHPLNLRRYTPSGFSHP